MITGQSYDEEIQFEVKGDKVSICVNEGYGGWIDMTGEASIKLGHALIEAGEKALKDRISEA